MMTAHPGDPSPLRTALYQLHVEAGARFTAFAGFELPLQYREGLLKEHLHTREAAGLFDISHMAQIAISGPQRATALETLTPADIVNLPAGRQRYAVLTNAHGGIIDDIVVANMDDELIVVANAARAEIVRNHFVANLASACTVRTRTDLALLAIQGPKAAEVLARLAPAVSAMPFQSVLPIRIDGCACRVSRSGYTGEDGYELALAADTAATFARRLLDEPEVELIGLGARDSLRLEAGLCLYGQDIDETTSLLEAGLAWTWAAARRRGGARAGGFPGAGELERERESGPSRLRMGLLPDGQAPVRHGVELIDATDITVGSITSGGFSPTLRRPIAMGYITAGVLREQSPIQALLRGRRIPMAVTTLPFVPHHYCR